MMEEAANQNVTVSSISPKIWTVSNQLQKNVFLDLSWVQPLAVTTLTLLLPLFLPLPPPLLSFPYSSSPSPPPHPFLILVAPFGDKGLIVTFGNEGGGEEIIWRRKKEGGGTKGWG